MTRLTDIIQITIDRQTQPVATTAFNVPMFLATHSNFSERAREYASTEAVMADFPNNSSVMQAARMAFAQNPRPNRLVVGRRNVPGATVSIVEVAPQTTYTMTLNGIPVSYLSKPEPVDEDDDPADTAVTICAGLVAAFNVSPVVGITLTDNTDGTITVRSSSTSWSLTTSANLSKSNMPSTEGWGAAILAVSAANSKWYGATIESHVPADVLEVAATIESMSAKKIFGTSTSSVAVKNATAGNILETLSKAGYHRTFLLWNGRADQDFPELGWMSSQLQEQPGSNTWSFKGIAGATYDELDDQESANIHDHKGNTYEFVGDANSTTFGSMVSGEWIDTMVGIDWFEARLRERLWFRQRNSKKIPYTKQGTTILETDVRAQLQEGIRVQLFTDTPAPRVRVRDANSMSPNDRARRFYDGIEFEAQLAGAIHIIGIRGVVTA
ncbi:structural protein [Pseudomonas phage vB_PaeM_VL12]|uniref:DUF3383 family protein n=1 Tax=Pseudomonas aeruginosa TaxID=287 RepID=UPI001CBF0FCB|nr:DUF3383 family protein [Pseudomonas aeruginosa]UKM53960.1 structural protein [Pseudomonas phage vB_PaeM_VL12]